jgi:hypothetical protein
VRIVLVLALALAGCSFVGIHYPDNAPPSGPDNAPPSGPDNAPPSGPDNSPPSGGVRCVTALPIADTVAATAALSAGSYRYAVETRTSPFPLAMVIVGAWATASAIYGYREDARCRSVLETGH